MSNCSLVPSSSSSSSEEEIYRLLAGKDDDSSFKQSSSIVDTDASGADQEKLRNKQKKAKQYYITRAKSTDSDDTSTTPEKKDEAPIYPDEPPKPQKKIKKLNKIFNFVIYIIAGYITGIFLVLIWYSFNRDHASTDLNFKWVCIVLLALVLLCPLQYQASRCIMALLVPMLGSSKGRALILGFAYLVAITCTVMNIVHNIELLIRSVACEQTMLKNALTPMHEFMGEPVHAVEQAVYICVSQVHKILEDLDCVLQDLEKPLTEIHEHFKLCYDWLQHKQHFFETQMGTPHDRCLDAGNISVQECHDKFGADNTACNIEQRFEWFCENVKDLVSFFDTNLEQQQQLSDQIFNRALQYFDKLRSIFEVSITFDHIKKSNDDHPAFDNNLELDITKIINTQLHRFFLIFTCLYFAILVLFIMFILTAIFFYINCLGSTFYNNFYITKEFEYLSLQQQKKYGYSVLPLHSIEVYTYIQFGSIRLLPFEKTIIFKPVLFMIYGTLQLFIVCFVDYSLYWFMMNMDCHSHNIEELQPPQYTKIVIMNGGMIGNILQGLVKAFEPLSKNLVGDIERCLPIPLPYTYGCYWKIALLCLVSWSLIIVAPYCQRLLHRIVANFYPENADKRAAYLHHHIMSKRDLIIKRARRRARSSNLYAYDSWMCKIRRNYRAFLYWISHGTLGSYKGNNCLICKIKLTRATYLDCETKDCRGVFCHRCFIDSNCHCILCSHKRAYGDLSDTSEFGDSSDDPEGVPYRPNNTQCKQRIVEIETRQKNA